MNILPNNYVDKLSKQEQLKYYKNLREYYKIISYNTLLMKIRAKIYPLIFNIKKNDSFIFENEIEYNMPLIYIIYSDIEKYNLFRKIIKKQVYSLEVETNNEFLNYLKILYGSILIHSDYKNILPDLKKNIMFKLFSKNSILISSNNKQIIPDIINVSKICKVPIEPVRIKFIDNKFYIRFGSTIIFDELESEVDAISKIEKEFENIGKIKTKKI